MYIIFIFDNKICIFILNTTNKKIKKNYKNYYRRKDFLEDNILRQGHFIIICTDSRLSINDNK